MIVVRIDPFEGSLRPLRLTKQPDQIAQFCPQTPEALLHMPAQRPILNHVRGVAVMARTKGVIEHMEYITQAADLVLTIDQAAGEGLGASLGQGTFAVGEIDRAFVVV